MWDEKKLARAFRALSSPNRLQLFKEILRRQQATGGQDVAPPGCLLTDYIQRLGIGAPTVSHHLRELEGAGLVALQRQGRHLLCRIEKGVPQALVELLQD